MSEDVFFQFAECLQVGDVITISGNVITLPGGDTITLGGNNNNVMQTVTVESGTEFTVGDIVVQVSTTECDPNNNDCLNFMPSSSSSSASNESSSSSSVSSSSSSSVSSSSSSSVSSSSSSSVSSSSSSSTSSSSSSSVSSSSSSSVSSSSSSSVSSSSSPVSSSSQSSSSSDSSSSQSSSSSDSSSSQSSSSQSSSLSSDSSSSSSTSSVSSSTSSSSSKSSSSSSVSSSSSLSSSSSSQSSQSSSGSSESSKSSSKSSSSAAEGEFVIGGPGGSVLMERIADLSGSGIALGVQTLDPFSNRGKTRVARLSGGAYVITWFDFDATEILGQQFDKFGDEIGSKFTVVNLSGFGVSDYDTGGLKNGNFVVVWTGPSGIQAYVYTNNVTSTPTQGSLMTIDSNTSPGATVLSPSLAGVSDGGFVISWSRREFAIASEPNIYVKKFNSSGGGASSRVIVNEGHQSAPDGSDTSGTDHEFPTICAITDGGAVVVWERQEFTTSLQNKEIIGRKIDASGSTPTTPGSDFSIAKSGSFGYGAGDIKTRWVNTLTNSNFVVEYRKKTGPPDPFVVQTFDGSSSNPTSLISELTFSNFTNGATGLPDGNWAIKNSGSGDLEIYTPGGSFVKGISLNIGISTVVSTHLDQLI